MIKNKLSTLIALPSIGSAFFGLVIFLFFAVIYPYHLHFQEQYQFFIYTSDYFLSFIQRPGGLADYLGSFLVQFYFYSWSGALIIASLLVLLQVLIYRIIFIFVSGSHSLSLPISFIPAVLYWALLTNEDYLLGGLIALIIISILIALYIRLPHFWWKVLLVFSLTPFFYWMIGGVIFFFVLFVLLHELSIKKHRPFFLIIFGLLSFCLIFIVAIAAKKILGLMYPTSFLLMGVRYFRYPSILPVMVGAIALLTVLIPFYIHYFIGRFHKYHLGILVFHWFLLLGGSSALIYLSSDMDKEEIMSYDFNVRMQRWKKIVDMADKKTPSSPITVACLNMALAKTGLIGDKIFSYYQNGTQGLIPDFNKDYLSSSVNSEIYYHLGMINTAQRYAFEAMEALPDYQKSVRSIKRLAETSLINGNYRLSKKYLYMLCHTTYYKKWATLVLEYIDDEVFIDSHAEWGQLRRFKPVESFLFSEHEKDMMLGLLFTHNPNNKLSFDYLMAYCLLNKDLTHFAQYFPIGAHLFPQTIPKHYQEAIFMYTELSTNKTDLNKLFINNLIRRRFMQYARIYNNSDKEKQILKKEFDDTFWYYLHF